MKHNHEKEMSTKEHGHNHHAHMAADFRKRFWIALVLTLPILVLSPLLQNLVGLHEAIRFPGDIYVLFGFSSAVFWYGGWPFLQGLFKELMPSDAHKRMPDGSLKDVPLSALVIDDQVLVKPGEKIPADGVIVTGESSVNEAMLTEESTPVSKKDGGKVIGGSINGEGALTISVKGTGKDSFLSQVIDLVKQAQESKSKTQKFADTAAMWLTFIALGSGAITLVVWLVFMHQDFTFAIERAVTVMVIVSPHALGLAVPLVVAVSTALAASNGLLLRNRAAFERARSIKAIIFDNTGTLTEGRFGVTDTLMLDEKFDEETLHRYAASVESSSEHPIATAIAAASEKKLPVTNFKSIPGKGAEGEVDGKAVMMVSHGYLREHKISMTDKRVKSLQSEGKTVVFVLVDGNQKSNPTLNLNP
jgi:Cu2+-exporting ATPase